MRKTFQRVVAEQLEKNKDIHLLLGDIGVFGFSGSMEKFPGRVLNMGIMEQSMIGFAAGIAASGGLPVVHTIAPFLVERPLEQLKIDFGYHGLPGKFISVGGSFEYSKLGATHHCPGDVEIISSIPNAEVWCPAGEQDLEKILTSELTRRSFSYIRLAEKPSTLALSHESGIAHVKNGNEGVCVAIGATLDDVLEAVAGLDIGVVSWVNPTSAVGLIRLLSQIRPKTVWIIEPFYEGGSSKALLPYISQFNIRFIGVPREFIHGYGTVEELKSKLGMDAQAIRAKVSRRGEV